MFKLVVFVSLFLNLQMASAQQISFLEIKTTNTQIFSFDLYVHSDCMVTDPGSLICAYNIGEGDFTEADFDLKVTYDIEKYEDGERTLLRELFITGNVVVIEFGFKDDSEKEDELSSALDQVEGSLAKAPHKLTLTYYGEGFDRETMSLPTNNL